MAYSETSFWSPSDNYAAMAQPGTAQAWNYR